MPQARSRRRARRSRTRRFRCGRSGPPPRQPSDSLLTSQEDPDFAQRKRTLGRACTLARPNSPNGRRPRRIVPTTMAEIQKSPDQPLPILSAEGTRRQSLHAKTRQHCSPQARQEKRSRGDSKSIHPGHAFGTEAGTGQTFDRQQRPVPPRSATASRERVVGSDAAWPQRPPG